MRRVHAAEIGLSVTGLAAEMECEFMNHLMVHDTLYRQGDQTIAQPLSLQTLVAIQ
jgi:hypothetical protein